MKKIKLSEIIAFLKATGFFNLFKGMFAYLKAKREKKKNEHIKKGKKPFFKKARRTKKRTLG